MSNLHTNFLIRLKKENIKLLRLQYQGNTGNIKKSILPQYIIRVRRVAYFTIFNKVFDYLIKKCLHTCIPLLSC